MLKYRKYIVAATLSIVLYVLFSIVFKKPIDSLLGGVIAGVVVLILSYVDLKNIKKEFNEMRYQVAEYVSDKDVEKFIKSHKNLIEKANDKSVKSMAMINLAGAYADKGDYEDARNILEELKLEDFGKRNYVNAGLNKILIYYRIEDYKKADALYDRIFVEENRTSSGPLFEITKIIRNYRGTDEGIRMLSNLNMQEGMEAYRNLIKSAKLIVKKGEVCADL